MAMPITGEPAPALCGAAEASAAERDEDCSAAKPLHRLPVALLAVGDAPASVGPASSSLALAAGFVATEPAKTGCPLPVVVMPCVAPLRRAPNCSAAEDEPPALPEPVVGSLPALLVSPWDAAAGLFAPELAGASVESAGSFARAGLPVKAGLVDSAAGVGAGAGLSAGSGARAGAAAGAGAGAGAGAAGAGAAGIGAGASGATAGAWDVAGGTTSAGGGAGEEGVPKPGPVQAHAKLAPTTATARAESTAIGKTLRTIGNPTS